MGTIWVREFTGGLDARRLPETTAGGVLIKALDGHINRGGEFEGRAAFVPEFTLPAGTVSMAYDPTGIYVFGHGTEPAGLPAGVGYQRLQHADGTTALTRLLSFDLYGGKIYAVGEFADGARFHFYDGVRVADWYDGRAAAAFTVTSGSNTPGTHAVGSFEVTSGTSNPGVNKITDVTIDGVSIISTTDIDHTGSNSTTASAIASAINSYSSSPEYTAAAVGAVVTVTASATDATVNGLAVSVSVAGDVTTGNAVNMAGGAAAIVSQLTTLKVGGVDIISGSVDWTTDAEQMAVDIADAINSYSSTPDYTATVDGDVVNILAAAGGAAANGRAVSFTVAAGLEVTPDTGLALAGGADSSLGVAAEGAFDVSNISGTITALAVDGVDILGATVTGSGTATTTAAAIASQINTYVSSPNYTATSAGATVTVTAVTPGAALNGETFTPTVTGSFALSNLVAFHDGEDVALEPGTFVRTRGSRVLTVSGPNLHGSGIQAPTKWTTDVVGAYFIDMSKQAANAETLTALAEYQQWMALFAERTILLWTLGSDPANNAPQQTLKNTGTASPRSVTQFGDADVFYLDESGLRSLKARDSSNAAATTDIGVPVDPLITAKLRSLTTLERQQCMGLIEPQDGRFWLIMKDAIYVFSFFAGAKISAWSVYEPAYFDEAGERVTFAIDDAVVVRRRVYLRSGDKIFVYGGLATGQALDKTQPELWLPYLDAEKPAIRKLWTSYDAAVRGEWEVSAAMRPDNESVVDQLGVVFRTTFNDETLNTTGESTHISLRFKGKATTSRKVLSSCAIHYADQESNAP